VTIWVDAQLSPYLAEWLVKQFGDSMSIDAHSVKSLGLRDAKDIEIFRGAREANAIVLTKDKDFVELLNRFGAPPKVIWLTVGNTSNSRIQSILLQQLTPALRLLAGQSLVEISDGW